MHPKIIEVEDQERGCGQRSAGRMYLRFDGKTAGCGKLPIELKICPCCGGGFGFSRTPTMLDTPEELWRGLSCKEAKYEDPYGCAACPLSNAYETGPALLLWVGEKYYPTPYDFNLESKAQGISRYIQHIPHGFIVGETWVLLAHKKAVPPVFGGKSKEAQPGIFSMFKPTRIEVVVTGDETDEVIEGYLKRGLTPVKVKYPEKLVLTQTSFLEDGE